MSLTASEEALVRQLLDQQAAILSLAGNEATITSKLGATKVTLADLVAASSLADADLLLTRQGTNDKSVRADILAAYMGAELGALFAPIADPTFTGNPKAPTAAQFDNDTSLATTAFVRSEILGQGNAVYDAIFGKSLTAPGYQKLPSGLIIQWGDSITSAVGNVTITFPITFPTTQLTHSLVVQSNGPYVLFNEFNTASSMVVGGMDLSGTRVQFGFSWIAIGY